MIPTIDLLKGEVNAIGLYGSLFIMSKAVCIILLQLFTDGRTAKPFTFGCLDK